MKKIILKAAALRQKFLTRQQTQNDLKKIARYYANHSGKVSVQKKTILYEVRDGHSSTDSPLAIYRFLKQQPKYADYQHIWVAESGYKQAVAKNLFEEDVVRIVERNTKQYAKALLSSKYLITNSTFQGWVFKQRDQVIVNTWHGTPLKHMGFDIPNNPTANQNVLRNFLMADYLISPNAHTTAIFRDGYRLKGLYNGQILESGYPRIDMTFNQSNFTQIFEEELFIFDSNKETILYTPTWRGGNVNAALDDIAKLEHDVQRLVHQFATKYNVLIKVHPFLYAQVQDNETFGERLVPDSLDPNEVLSLTDILITDYSSIFFDYLVTNKPILFYVYDRELYASERGMYIEESELPGPILENIEDLIDSIENISQVKVQYKDTYVRAQERFVNYDDGHVTPRLVQTIFENKPAVKMISLNDQREKLVFYGGGMITNGITTSFFNLLSNIDQSKYDVTVLLDIPRNSDKHKNNLKLPATVRPMYDFGMSSLRWHEKIRNKLVTRYGAKGLLQALLPKKGYQREMKRLLANQSFDVAIDFSGYNYFWLWHMLFVDAKKHYVYLHNDIWADAHRPVNGQYPFLKVMLPMFTLYRYFDGLINVGQAVHDINTNKLRQYVTANKQLVAHNTVDFAANEDKYTMNQTMNLSWRLLRLSQVIHSAKKEVTIFAHHDATDSKIQLVNSKYDYKVDMAAENDETGELRFRIFDYQKQTLLGWGLAEEWKTATVVLDSEKVNQWVFVNNKGAALRRYPSVIDDDNPAFNKTWQLRYLLAHVSENVLTNRGRFSKIKIFGTQKSGWVGTGTLVTVDNPLLIATGKRINSLLIQKIADEVVNQTYFVRIPANTTGWQSIPDIEGKSASITSREIQVGWSLQSQIVGAKHYYLVRLSSTEIYWFEAADITLLTMDEIVGSALKIQNYKNRYWVVANNIDDLWHGEIVETTTDMEVTLKKKVAGKIITQTRSWNDGFSYQLLVPEEKQFQNEVVVLKTVQDKSGQTHANIGQVQVIGEAICENTKYYQVLLNDQMGWIEAKYMDSSVEVQSSINTVLTPVTVATTLDNISVPALNSPSTVHHSKRVNAQISSTGQAIKVYKNPVNTDFNEIIATQTVDHVIDQAMYVDGYFSYHLTTGGYVASNDVKVIDYQNFSQYDVAGNIKPDDFVFIIPARLSPEKNHDMLIKAFAQLVSTRPKVHLVVLGGGPLFGYLNGLIEHLGVQDNVHMFGRVNNVSELLQSSDAFVLYSLYEGFPMVLLEAMQVDMLITATNITTSAEALGNGRYGLLTKEITIESMVETLSKLMDNNYQFEKFNLDNYNTHAVQEFEKIMNQ